VLLRAGRAEVALHRLVEADDERPDVLVELDPSDGADLAARLAVRDPGRWGRGGAGRRRRGRGGRPRAAGVAAAGGPADGAGGGGANPDDRSIASRQRGHRRSARTACLRLQVGQTTHSAMRQLLTGREPLSV
jgi:hypothetical protein